MERIFHSQPTFSVGILFHRGGSKMAMGALNSRWLFKSRKYV